MKSVKKFDARPKVRGVHKFIDDYSYDNMIFAKLLYSKKSHAKIKDIKYPKDFNLDEFEIISYKDIPGENIVPEPVNDQPFLAKNEVFHYGQILRVIGHPSKNKLEEFIKQTEIVYEELPAKTDFKKVLQDTNNAFGKTHIIDHSKDTKPEKNWVRHHKIYYTPHQEQLYLEPQGVIAWFDKNEKVSYVQGTMQCPYFVKAAVDNIMGKEITRSVIETSEGIGGAFGGKEDYPNIIGGLASLLAYKSGKRVKLVFEREEDLNLSTKRHPAYVEIETYTDPESKELKKMRVDYRLDAGAYQTLSPVVLSRGILHTSGGYKCDDVYIKGELYRSNTPPNGAFRGFGAPQGFFGIESHIDNIADDLNIDPYEFRKINVFHPGDEFPTTQKVETDFLEKSLDNVITKSEYRRKIEEYKHFNENHKDKKGIGIAMFYHGGGFTGNGEKVFDSEVKVCIENGEVKIYVVNVDMGQGAHTTLAQMVAEELDMSFDKVNVQIPNTDKSPDSGPTVASRTIYVIGNLLKKLAVKIKDDCGGDVQNYIDNNGKEFCKEYRMNFQPDPNVKFDEDTYQGTAYKDYSHESVVAEIYFHADTYQIEVKKLWIVIDIGHTVNKDICIGQIQGGTIQAVGYGTTEYWFKEGFGVKGNISGYIVPTAIDVPEMKIEFINNDSDLAKGLGEIPMNGPAAAIRNAFLNATGVKIDEIPLIPETIFKHMEQNN